MKKLIVLVLLVLFMSCGRKDPEVVQIAGPQGPPGAAASPVPGPSGAHGEKGDKGDQGNPGINGQDAPQSPYDVVKVLTPCGPNSSPFKEVLLLLANGEVLASFSDAASGLNTRFALIPDGSYVDTDSSHCNFTLSTSGHTRSISWTNGGYSWTIE